MVFLGLTLFTLASEKKLKREELPPEVRQSIDKLAQGATVKGYAKEVDSGAAFYEVELVVKGHTKDVLVDESGAIVEIEEEVALDALPAPVAKGLTEQANGGKIAKVESLTKRGVLVAYEAVIHQNGKGREIQVGPNGERLKKHE